MILKCIECIRDHSPQIFHNLKRDSNGNAVRRSKPMIAKDVHRVLLRAKRAITVHNGDALCEKHIVEKVIDIEI